MKKSGFLSVSITCLFVITGIYLFGSNEQANSLKSQVNISHYSSVQTKVKPDTLNSFPLKTADTKKEQEVVFFYDLVINYFDFSKSGNEDSSSPGILISEAIALLLKQFKI